MEDELQHRLMKKQGADDALFVNLHQQYDLIASRIDSVQLWLNQGAHGEIEMDVAPTPVAVQPSVVESQQSSNVVSLPVAKAAG